jgi:glycosyltransferase involved in cell wall biosynthesis
MVCPFFHPVLGGMETYTLNLCLGLKKMGHEVQVYSSDLTRTGRFEKKEEVIEGIPVKRIKTVWKFGEFGAIWPGIVNELLKDDFDLIHAHSYRHPHTHLAHVVSKLRGKKFVMTGHWPEFKKGLRKWWLDEIVPFYDMTLGRIILSTADAFIACSPTEYKWFKKRGAKNISTILHAVRSEYLQRYDGEKFRKKYGLGNSLMILAFGRVNREKNVETIIKSLPIILKKHNGVKLCVAGAISDENYKKELDSIIEQLEIKDRVIFTGAVSEEEKMQAYAACDVFAHAPLYEGFDLVPLEVMTQVKPIVISGIGENVLMIKDHENGILFDPRNHEDLAKKIIEVIGNEELREKISLGGRKLAEGLTWEVNAKKHEEVYEKVLGI